MLIVCGFCGGDGDHCGCRPPPEELRSNLLDVCLTAAAIRGRVDAASIMEAKRLLEEEPS